VAPPGSYVRTARRDIKISINVNTFLTSYGSKDEEPVLSAVLQESNKNRNKLPFNSAKTSYIYSLSLNLARRCSGPKYLL